MTIEARYEDTWGGRFCIQYKNKGSFLRAVTRGKKDVFVDAVDFNTGEVVKGSMGLTLYKAKGKKL